MAVSKNSLFATLALYARLYKKAISEAELTAGLPLAAGGSTEDLLGSQGLEGNFTRAAERAGLQVTLRRQSLADISPLSLPAILVMKDETGCILDRFENDKAQCRILLPESEQTTHLLDIGKVQEQYAGLVFFLGDLFDPGGRTAEGQGGRRGHWFWHAIRTCWTLYFDVLVASFVLNLFALVSPLFTMNVYDRVVPNNALETLWVLGIGTALVTGFDALLKFLRAYFTEIAAKKSDILISSRLFEKVLDLRMEDAPRNIGSFASNLREYDSIRNFLTSSVMLVVVDMPFTVILLGVVHYLGGRMVVVPLVMMALILLYTLIVRGPLYRRISATHEDTSRKNSLVVETLSGLSDIKQLGAAGLFQGRWERLVADIAGKGIGARLMSVSISTLTGVCIQLNTIITIIMGVYMINDREMSMGALIAIMILSSRIIAPMGQMVALLSTWNQTQVAYASLQSIMDRSVESFTGRELIRKETLEGDIEFREVTFTYPGAEQPALKNVSFHIKRGEHVAILGRMGAGKSTIHRLLMGLFRPQEGRVFIDHLDINELSPILLRRNINHVPQDFHLFSGTLRENVTLRAPHADDSSLIAAALTGGLETFIRSSPRGIDTVIQERGANLSMGQRQGVAIARAFLTVAPIILLDEPANSMDGATESLVMNQLRQRMIGKTTLIATHKHSMLDLIQRILVVDAGKIVFDGSREEFHRKFGKKVANE